MESLIFKPDKNLLLKAKERRVDRWEELEKTRYTREQQLERIKLDIEVFESMKIVKERAMQCIGTLVVK